MPAGACTFQVGSIRCSVLADGYSWYPAGWFFPGIDAEELSRALEERQMPTDHVLVPHTCLLLETGRHVVVVDTGAGPDSPTGGALPARLELLGIRPQDVDTVILTHAHPDHIGGAVNRDGRPVFPWARYVLAEAEADFWNAVRVDLRNLRLPVEFPESMRTTAQRALRALRFQLEPVNGEVEVVPGVHVVPAPGHTPGHVAVRISSEGSQFLNLADAMLHPLHLEEPDWENSFDQSPAEAAATRRSLLQRAAAEDAPVMAFHFPFPSVGRIAARPEGGWRWTPGW